MNDIEDADHAEHVLNNLRQKRDALVAHGAELSEERTKLAFGAHTGDQAARKKLDAINRESALHDSEMRSLDAAISEAAARVERARQAEAQAADRLKAEEAQAVAARIGARMQRADKFLAQGFDELAAAEREIDQLHQNGVVHPSHNVFRVNSIISLKTLLRKLPITWRRDFADRIEIAPNERQSLSAFWGAVSTSISNQLRQRLGEAGRNTEAA
jgi:hypothetical protein